MQPVQQPSVEEVFASYNSKSLRLEFKKKAKEIFAEQVLDNTHTHYPIAPSCFKIQGIPPENQTNQVETIQWLLKNRFIPSIQNQQIVFTSSESQWQRTVPSAATQPASSLQKHPLELKSESEYISQLEEAEKEKAYLRMVEALNGLGQVYFLKGQLTVACKVFNSAIALNDTYSQNASLKQLLLESLVKVEAAFITKHAGKPQTFIEGTEKILGYRRQLIDLRNKHKQSTASMKKIFATVTKSRVTLTQNLVNECFAALGHPPCSYALVSMGSMSRCEASHFSDLEFAILLAADSPANREYFRRLTRLLELKIINLGETEFPILHHGLESPTPSGFCLDSGGNSPLGKEGLFELIGTPAQLAGFLSPDWFAQDLIMSNAMSNLDIIMGDQGLLFAYEKCAQVILDKPLVEKGISLPAREHRALTLLRGDILEFAPRLDRNKEQSKVFDIKKELYRLPNSMLNALAIFYNLKAKNSWERIAELCQRGLISQEGAQNLTWAIDEITRFRLATHLHYGSENEKVFYQPQSDYEVYQWKAGNYYILQESDLTKIAEVFQVILPLYEAAKRFCETYGQVNPFKTNSLKEQSLFAQAEALWHANSYNGAKELYKKVIALDPTNATALIKLGETFVLLSSLEEGAEYLYKALSEFERKYVEGQPELDQQLAIVYIIILRYLGYALQQKPEEALKYFQKALNIYHKYEIDQKLDLARIYSTMATPLIKANRIQEALEHLEEATKILEACKENSGDESLSFNNALGSALNNLAFLYMDLKDYTKAVDYFKKAIQVGGANGGSRLTALGAALHHAGHIEEGIITLKMALEVGEKTFGKVHPDVATTLSYLGMTYQDLNDYKKAQSYFKQELYINEVLNGVWHESNIPRWERLAETAQMRKAYNEELICRRSGVAVTLECFGSKSIELIEPYLAICVVEKNLQHHEASIDAAERALALYEASYGKKGKGYGGILSYLLLAVRDTDPKRAVRVAMEDLNFAIECSPPPSEAVGMSLLNLGNLYKKIGNKEQAIEYYDKSHDMFCQVFGLSHPQTQKALQRLRELDPQRTKEWDDHSRGLESLVKAFLAVPASELPGLPQNSSLTREEEFTIMLHLNKAKISTDKRLAVSELSQLINKFPADPRGYFALGDIYKKQNMFAAAQELFERLLTHNVDHIEANYQLGLMLSLQKQTQKAYLYLKKCLELHPEHEEALNLLKQLDDARPKKEMTLIEEELETITHSSTDLTDTFYQLYQEIKDGKVAKLQELYPFNFHQTDESGHSLVHYSVMYENFDAMVFLCEKGANVDLADKQGSPPIAYACSPRLKPFFDYLLGKKARLDLQRKKNGFNCFHQCAYDGNAEAISNMLDQKIFPVEMKTGLGLTPLYLACQKGHIETAKLLISRGADVNAKNTSGWAPIHIAAGEGHLAVVTMLLDNNADPDVIISERNAFFLAIQKGRLETMKELGKRHQNLLETKDESGYPPLLSACVYKQNHLLLPLIELGAKTTEIWDEQPCFSHIIAAGYVEAVETLLPKVSIDEVRRGIFCAVETKQDKILDLLLEKEEDVSALVDAYTGQETPLLIFACCFGTVHAVQMLLEKGANASVMSQGCNILHAALQEGNDDVAEFIIRNKIVPLDALTTDIRKTSALAYAVKCEKIPAIRLLVENGADINCQVTDYKVTPCHLALTQDSRLEIIQILLSSKHPYLNLQSGTGGTPIDLAGALGHNEILMMFVQAIFDQGTEKAKELLSHNTKVEITLQDDAQEELPEENLTSTETRTNKKKKRCVIQ